MNRLIVSIFSFITIFALNAAVSFTGTTHKVITEKPEASTGLNHIYVLNSLNGVQMIYTASTTSPVTWYKYSNLGGGYAEEVAGVKQSGKTYTLNLTGSGDMGYIIEEGSNRYYCWVVDHSQHSLTLNSLGFATEQDCDMTELIFQGSAKRIVYYTINGQAKELNRDIKLTYNTLEYNETSETYDQVVAEKSFSYLNTAFRTNAPLCNTEFTLTGDKYLKAWGMEETITSEYFNTLAVEAKTSATACDWISPILPSSLQEITVPVSSITPKVLSITSTIWCTIP